ncbi:hypothetical protein B0H66DRAFT_590641 [Apodospora peruviana]|uniref:Uncharacterized protein n=1 Tax=Apodospora peruviana TaxID=516989 RepID=A0AAE0IDC5_9PEZI|nr:hypothetical protein B0H66DRAFT_590641 [Apodospora peruviana]
MEPVSLVLGVIPLIGVSVKGYKKTHAKLKDFRHYSREIDRIRRHFERQRQFFLNEIHLILRLALSEEPEEHLVEELIDDGAHPLWHSSRLETAFVARFQTNCKTLKDIAEDISGIINDTEMGLECFEILEQARQKGESIKDTVRRLRGRIKVAFDKSQFDDWIGDLRSSNADLRLLREQVGELDKPRTTTIRNSAGGGKRLPPEFGSYGATRRASQALYDALWAAWSKQDAANFRHLVKLFLETNMKADEGVQLNLVISCLGQDDHGILHPEPSVVKVHVKSQMLDFIGHAGLITQRPDAQGDASGRVKRRRVVNFALDSDSDSDSQAEVADQTQPTSTTATVDLQQSQHICAELLPRRSQLAAAAHNHSQSCIGYLDTSSHDRIRHSFYQCCSPSTTTTLQKQSVCHPILCRDASPSLYTNTSPVPLNQILQQPRSDELSVPAQLQLALRIASAVLKFNSTSWLGEIWGLSDLYFFEQRSEAAADLPTSLQTLHLGREWSSSPAALLPTLETDNNMILVDRQKTEMEDAKLTYGIHNVTMYNLGVALLSIGRWSAVDANDVLCVRKMARETCPLGPRYQELTQRVLDCDFGFGKDLRKPKLQEAVYDGVLVELEGMIAALGIR